MKKRTVKPILILIIIMGLWSCAYLGRKTENMTAYDLPLNIGVRDASFLTDMEKEIILELNEARTNPKTYAEYLKSLKDKPGWATGLKETIPFLEKMDGLPPFKVSKGLSLAAQDLAKDLGPKGLTGHTGSDGKSLFDRMNRYGQWEEKAGENLSYGYREADELVARTAIDASTAGKDQGKYLFDKDFLVVGVACGTHKTYGVMCAIDFARGYKEKPDPQ